MTQMRGHLAFSGADEVKDRSHCEDRQSFSPVQGLIDLQTIGALITQDVLRDMYEDIHRMSSTTYADPIQFSCMQ